MPTPTPRPREVLITGAYFPEMSSGGLQSQAAARALHGRMDIVVLTTSTDPALPAHDIVERVPVSRICVDVESRWSLVMATLRMTTELLRLLPRVNFAHIQGYSTKNILVSVLAKLFARPVILHLQTAKHDEPETVQTQGRLAWWAFSTADLYLSVSPSLTDRYLVGGLPADRIREVPNGVGAARFTSASPSERQALRRRLNLPEDRPIVLFVGVMMPVTTQKGSGHLSQVKSAGRAKCSISVPAIVRGRSTR